MFKGFPRNLIGFCICCGMLVSMACTAFITASMPKEKEPELQRIGNVPAGDRWYILQFINDKEGWLANAKNIWRTSDGGKNWKLIYSGEPFWHTEATINMLEFINSQTGYILVSPDGIYKTKDGGDTWKHLASPFPNGAIYSIKFHKEGNEGWAAGIVNDPPPPKYKDKFTRGDRYAVIAHTINGGQTWSQQIIPFTETITNFYFLDEKNGWALGWPGLFSLKDSIKRWDKINFFKGGCANQGLLQTVDGSSNGKGMAYEPVAIYFIDSNQGWLSFKNGYMADTKDGGNTWCDLLEPKQIWPDVTGNTYFSKLHFINPMIGWALGNGTLYKTTDGGASWINISMRAEFKEIYFLGLHQGWAIANGELFRINN